MNAAQRAILVLSSLLETQFMSLQKNVIHIFLLPIMEDPLLFY